MKPELTPALEEFLADEGILVGLHRLHGACCPIGRLLAKLAKARHDLALEKLISMDASDHAADFAGDCQRLTAERDEAMMKIGDLLLGCDTEKNGERYQLLPVRLKAERDDALEQIRDLRVLGLEASTMLRNAHGLCSVILGKQGALCEVCDVIGLLWEAADETH